MNKKSIRNGLISLLLVIWVTGIFVGVSVLFGLLVDGFASDRLKGWLDTPLGSTVYSTLIYAVIAGIVVQPLRRQKGKQLLESLGLKKFNGPTMFVWALFMWGLSMLASMAIGMLLYSIRIPGLDLEQKQNVGFQTVNSGFEYALVFFVLVVLAPVVEELIFRGYLYKQLRQRGSMVFAALVTSAVFAGLHIQPNVVINVFILSLFLCYLRERFDSIWPGVMLHALKNGLAYALLFILPLYGIKLI